MVDNTMNALKEVITNSIGVDLNVDWFTEDFKLVGNVLDSMAVINLILALEEHFGFTFEDEDLSVEAFETVRTLAELVDKKIKSLA